MSLILLGQNWCLICLNAISRTGIILEKQIFTTSQFVKCDHKKILFTSQSGQLINESQRKLQFTIEITGSAPSHWLL